MQRMDLLIAIIFILILNARFCFELFGLILILLILLVLVIVTVGHRATTITLKQPINIYIIMIMNNHNDIYIITKSNIIADFTKSLT